MGSFEDKDKIYKEKFLAFGVRMVKLKKFLNTEKHEYCLADQILRSGTSIGANHREAIYAESDSDFVHKLAVSQKECSETLYWLDLLYAAEYIDEKQYKSLYEDAEEIMKMLTSSILSAKKKLTEKTNQ